jgi:N-methylhydantoinase B/oxoprolinase/acetone carboxylase alpha subunit
MDSIELEILWSNLIGIVTERAKALQRIAFSPVVREAGDLACALFDQRGRPIPAHQAISTRWPSPASIWSASSRASASRAMC